MKTVPKRPLGFLQRNTEFWKLYPNSHSYFPQGNTKSKLFPSSKFHFSKTEKFKKIWFRDILFRFFFTKKTPCFVFFTKKTPWVAIEKALQNLKMIVIESTWIVLCTSYSKCRYYLAGSFRHHLIHFFSRHSWRYLLYTRRKLNVHKTFRRRPGRLLNGLCTFNLRPVSRFSSTDSIVVHTIFESLFFKGAIRAYPWATI